MSYQESNVCAIRIAEINYGLKQQDAPEFDEVSKDIEAEDLLADKENEAGLGVLCEVLNISVSELIDAYTETHKEHRELEQKLFKALMNKENTKDLLMTKAKRVFQTEIQERLESLNFPDDAA